MSEPTIYELMDRVRAHPDYVFGTVFTRDDFTAPDEYSAEYDPDTFPTRQAEDRLAEFGNSLIEDLAR